MKWYSKYLSIYGVDFGQVKPEIVTEIRKAVDAKGGKMVILHINDELRNIFTITGFFALFDIRN